MGARSVLSVLSAAVCTAPALVAGSAAGVGPAVKVPRWQRFEAAFESSKDHKHPLHDVQLSVEFTSPSGVKTTVEGFWDGGRTFRVRFSPDEVGAWRFETRASDPQDGGLHGKTGGFACVPAAGRGNPLWTHGPLRRADDRTHLVHADGTPFFWLADTAWAGPLMSAEKDWVAFLRDRRAKRFNAVQVMATQNIATAGDATGRQAFFVDGDRLGLEPAFWQRLDRRFDLANQEGLVMAPSFSWAATWHPWGKMLNPAAVLDDEQLVVLLRYAQARYGAHHLVWLLGGDIDYSPQAERWRRIGRRVFGDRPRHLVTMHPAPRKLHFADFKDEPWLGFLGYQSSHSTREVTLRWITTGEPATAWRESPRYPIINIEPPYEDHNDGHTGQRFAAVEIRRAAYWSVLVSPTAGVSYGAHGVWSWEPAPNLPMSHPKTGVARPWFEAMRLPGSAHMKVLAEVFTAEGRPWHRLRPVPEAVADQPGRADPLRFVAAARTEDGRLFVAYVPGPGAVTLDLTGVAPGARAVWIDPTNGRARPAAGVRGGAQGPVTPPAKNAAGETDFVLLLHAPGPR